MFCRNCDTAIEVSERDVSTFESQGTFECPSCKEDLSARMSDLLGTRPPPSEERTVAEEEEADADAFAGLPVGGTLDEAAREMRSPSPSAGGGVSSTAGAVPEPVGEDPLTLALRIAHQAQAAAMAAAAAAESEAPVTNGAHPHSEPNSEPTAPGMPSFPGTNGASGLGNASSKVGVVPEEPDNEDTVRRDGHATASTVDSANGSEATIPEPTLPSESDLLVSDTSDSGPVIGEETPALTDRQRAELLADEGEPDTVIEESSQPGTVPDAPTAEPTPSSPRPAPMPAEPREEPTLRKSSPPPSLVAPARLAPRTGTGPSGIGALGFRISSNRAVVRPNGRVVSAAAAPTTPAAGTPMSGSTSIERVSMERSIDRPSRTGIPVPRSAPIPPVVTGAVPEPPPLVAGRASASGDRAGGVPVWLLGAGVGVVALLVAGLAYLVFGGRNPEKPVATPTPVVESSPEPIATAVVVLGTPIATVSSSTRTPSPTRTATPVPTQTATATSAPAGTAVAIAPTLTPKPSPTTKVQTAKEKIDQIVRNRPPGVARLEIYGLRKSNPGDPDLLFEAFRYLSQPPAGLAKEDADTSKKMARELAKDFTTLYRNDNRAPVARQWMTGYDKEKPPGN